MRRKSKASLIILLLIIVVDTVILIADQDDIVIHEILYNPDASNTGGEFVEIYNSGATAVDVSDWQLVDSTQVMFTLPAGTTMAAGEYLVFYDDEEAIAFYGLNPASSYGPYTGGLSGDGEIIQLKNVSQVLIDEVTYDDNWPWSPQPDGDGPSLEMIDPASDNNDPSNWGIGQPYSPGQANNPTFWGDGDIVISELMYHSGSTNWGGEYIELYNRSTESIDLGGWYLEVGIEYIIPCGTTLAAGEYLVIAGDPNVPAFYRLNTAEVLGPYERDLGNGGDLVVLRNTSGQVVTVVNYNDQAPWPREADGFGPSLELITLNGNNNDPSNWGIGQPYTPGVANAPAISGGGDVVITEIMYHPLKKRYMATLNSYIKDYAPDNGNYWQDGDDPAGEYVELYNRSGNTVNLAGWQLIDEEGVLYTFTTGSIAAYSDLVVCSDALAIRSHYGISNAVGNFSTSGDRLSNGGERLTLVNSQGVLVDAVDYNDTPPWPIGPDQNGVSLECLDPLSDNNRAENWRGCTVTEPTTPSSPDVGDEYFLTRGTPGQVNSRTTNGLPPFVDVDDIKHSPKRPTSVDPMTITVDVSSDDTISSVVLHYNVYVAPYQSPISHSIADPNDTVEVLFEKTGALTGEIVPFVATTTVNSGNTIVLFVMPQSGTTASDDWVQTTLTIEEGIVNPYGPWDFNADMDPSVTNDTGIWAYGYGDGTTFRGLMTMHPGTYVWVADTPGEPDPHIFKNVDGTYDWVGLDLGTHGMNGGSTGEGAAVRWTAPIGGDISITGEMIMRGNGPTADYRLVKSTSSQSQSVPMYDDGLHGDNLAGDGEYGAFLPAQDSQSLVRYRITVRDSMDRSWTYPDAYEPNPNRAYFVYDGEEDTNLPIYFLIAPQATWDYLYSNIWTHDYQEATLVVEGIVYDHVGVHLKGMGWRVHPKKSYKIAFNKTEYLHDMSHLDIAMHVPVIQKLSHDIFSEIGQVNLGTEMVRLYRNGEFYGVYLAEESPNSSWLERHGMDGDGEVYKASCLPPYTTWPQILPEDYVADLDYYGDAAVYPQMYEKKGDSLGSFASLIDLCDKVASTSEAEIKDILYDEVELDTWLYNWAVHVAAHNNDLMGQNYFVIKPSELDAKWRLHCFDFSGMFSWLGAATGDTSAYAANPYTYSNKWQVRCYSNSILKDRFLKILADVMDHYMTIDQIHVMIDEYYDYTLQDRTDEMTIRAEWNSGVGPFVFTEARRDAIKTFYTNRWNWLKNTWLPSQGYTLPSNAHPTIEVISVTRTADGIQIQWQYNDVETDACTVDLYWLDKRWSQVEPIPGANDLPAGDGSFLWTNGFPYDEYMNRGIYIHAVIHDDVSDLPGHDTSDTPLLILENCNQVWNSGYGMREDLNQDCQVNLQDAALITSEWLQRNIRTALIAENAPKHVLNPTSSYPSDDNWKGGQVFDDSSWSDYSFLSGKAGGVGYELSSGFENYISYNIGGANGNQTRYIRVHFNVDAGDLLSLTSMTLRMRYDDAFVAYINGVEVTRSDFVPDPLNWNSGAMNFHDDSLAVQFEDFDVSSHVSALHAGDNILALHALNYMTSSSDFLMSIELVGGNNNPLIADINGDNTVDLDDLFWLALEWLNCNDPEHMDCINTP